jgi:hypothetical protein
MRGDTRWATAVSPGDSHAIKESGDAATASSAEPVDAFKRALLGLAQTTHCADCLRWRNGLPFNFYVEVPSAPLDLEPTSPRRHAGWWLLAFLSGQFDPDVAVRLPEVSPWRRALGTDGDWGDERFCSSTELGGLGRHPGGVADAHLGRRGEGRVAMPAVGTQRMGRTIAGRAFQSSRYCGHAMTLTEDAVVLPIAGDPLLVGALLLRVMAQLDDVSGAPAAPPAQCATIAGLRALSPAETWRLGGMRKVSIARHRYPALAENLRALLTSMKRPR